MERPINFVDEWYLMGSPLPIVMILGSYLLFVLKIGPEYMKKRKPYQFQNIILLYNAVQVCYSCFLVYISFQALVPYGLCPKTCVTEIEYIQKSTSAFLYCYLWAKLSELLDTIFFVLRKKNNQVSFLHVYHHTLMAVVTWIVLKYEPSYKLVFPGLVNSFVHVIMYIYYGLSSFPSLAKYLWWKKYITSMQLIQFVVVLFYFAVAVVKSECTPSYILSAVMAINGAIFLYLFGTFYIRTYSKKTNCKAGYSNEIKMDNGVNNNLHEMDYNGTKVSNGNGANGTKCTNVSIKLNDAYRIKFNLESKKLM